MPFLLPVHVLAVCLWVGGMFFAWMILRPSVSELDSAQRLELWKHVLKRFFAWVWLAVIAIGLTGYIMMLEFFGGFKGAPLYIQIMQGLYWLMTLLFIYVVTSPYFNLARHVNDHDWGLAAGQLSRIRRIVGLNLILGITTICVATAGRFL